jgi:putative membrane protein
MGISIMVILKWFAMTLGWLSHDNQYQLFLAPKFGFLIYISMAFFLIFALGMARVKVRTGIDHCIKGMILLLPVLFIFSVGENTLGNFALSKRTIKPMQTDSVQNSFPEISPPQPIEDPAGQTMPLVSISHLIRNWDAYDGKRITVDGLFSETVVGQESLSAVFRYFISCCAADAIPVGIFIPRQKGSGMKNDDWVRVAGRVHMTKRDDYDVIFMELESIEKREKPSKNATYLFN